MTLTPAIAIVAYNRPRSLERLLQSIRLATYPSDDIPLVISIDHAPNNREVLALANAFEWQHGSKKIVYQEENLGLRNHILQCGAYALTYGSVIILEDDLYVSPNFYNYAQRALQFVEDKPYISGVSLYSHQFNVHSRSHFAPLDDGYDNWYFQFASSWGQAWTKKQWEAFYIWYKQQETLLPQPNLPENVTRWSEKSWLKYFIAYLVTTDTYFLYPRISYTTNFSDTGTHIGKDSTTFQVPLDFSDKTNFTWGTLQESNSVYDAFYENRKLYFYLNLPEAELLTNLYGKKPISVNIRYVLTDKILPFEVLKKFGRSLKPHDANIIADITGDDLFLYDCQVTHHNTIKLNAYRKVIYNIKSLNRQEAKIVFFQLVRDAFTSTLKKLGL